MSTDTAWPSFNLLNQPWIPVAVPNGPPQEVSLLELIEKASEFSGIEHSDPLVTIATYRFVLAFLHRALDGPVHPKQTAEWYQHGFPAEQVRDYARTWQHRFDLFDAERPFLQQPGIEREAFLDHWTRLSSTRGSFNTNVLFRPQLRTPKELPEDAITPAEAALELLSHQSFTLGGLIKRFVTSAKSSPVATAALTLVVGESLLNTLCLNLVTYDKSYGRETEQPVWERELPSLTSLEKGLEVVINGLTTQYVWPARAILLQPNGQTKIQTMYYAAGQPPSERRYHDPMVTTVKNSKGDEYPMAYREGKALWRDLHSFVPRPEEHGGPKVIKHASDLLRRVGNTSKIPFAVFGMVNNKAKIVTVRREELRLPTAVVDRPQFADQLSKLSQTANDGAFRLKVALQVLSKALLSPGEGADTKDINAQVNAFQWEERYWPTAEVEFWKFIDTLSADPGTFAEVYADRVEGWEKNIGNLVYRTYDDITDTLGRSAQTLRAIERGRFNLKKGFKKKSDVSDND